MRVDGVDVSEESVATAKKVAGGGGKFTVGAAEALPAADGAYDAAISVESVYFWPDLGKGLREMRRVVREGGFAAAAVECSDPEKARMWTELVGGGMRVRTAAELAEAFREAEFAEVEAKEDAKSGMVCVVGRKAREST
jgi:ubiquinone/menaquinone biosynthesis C-methylase UbiE